MPTYHATQQAEQMVITFDVGKWLLDSAVLVGGDLGKETATRMLTWLADMGIATQLTFTIPIVQLPHTVEETAALEPQFVLDEISRAINQAEGNLNKNNFAIASGQVETSVIMGNEKGERIQAKIAFQIMPQENQ